MDMLPFPEDNAKCFASHLGLWAVEPHWMNLAVAQVQKGLNPLFSVGSHGYTNIEGIGVITIVGHISKAGGKFGGTSSVLTRRAILQARDDDEVRAILLHIDSPGGQVAGVKELADSVEIVGRVKPVFSFIEDLGASAAFWTASRSRLIFANATAQVGSIGTMMIVVDSAEMAKREGIRVIPITTGEFKAAGAPGTKIEDRHIEAWRELVEGTNAFFTRSVQEGRGLSDEELTAVSDGKVHLAEQAQRFRLIDTVVTPDEVLSVIQRTIGGRA